MSFVNENGEFVFDWETSAVAPFCFPIGITKGILKNKKDILDSIEYKEFSNYNTIECSRSDNLVNQKEYTSLVSQIIKNFLNVNDRFYQYDFTNISPYVTSLWANKYTKNQYITSHVHPNSWFSGVYYPHGTGTTEILFENPITYSTIEPPRKTFNQYNSSTWGFTFPEDTMIFFPSYLRHQTFKHQDDIDKISISFNIFLKGKLHDYNSYIYLEL